MITRITLLGEVPSLKNSKRIFCKGRRPIVLPSEKHQAWHTEQLQTSSDLKNCDLRGFDGVCSIIFTLYPKTRHKRDLSNSWESVGDLLVDAGILKDDNLFIISELVLRFGEVDSENPRAEITIEYEEKEVFRV